MAKPRKTVDVALVKERANFFLTNPDGSPAERRGVANILETVLHESGNYHGFRYADPTAQRTPEGYLITGTYDDTRRCYY